MAVRDWEKAFMGPGAVALSSARSITESVADWPRHLEAQVLTKSSTMFRPSCRVVMELFRLRAVSQSV